MSDSDSGHAPIPSDETISRALEDSVISTYKEGNTDDLTVKRIRTKAEQQLGLPSQFFKTDAHWKTKSHTIILDAVDKHCNDDAPEPAPTPKPKAKAKPKPAAPKQTKKATETPRGVKRSKPAPKDKKPQKRRKTAVSSEEESDAVMSDAPSDKDEDVSDAESDPPKKTVKRKKKVVASESEGEDANGAKPMSNLGIHDDDEDEDEDTVKSTPAKKGAAAAPMPKDDLSESELSELLDESPVKKKRQKKEPTAKKEKTSKAAKPAKSKAKAKPPLDDDPDQAEIKRLQGWLVKCGIRKLWGKELAKFDTPKEKIRHLKEMLKDAGMDGKYSVEKAARIKEQRELMADLEAVQAAEQHWGAGATDGGRPRRRAAAAAVARQPIVQDNDDSDDDQAQDKEEDDKDDDDDDDASEPSQHGGSTDSGSGSDHDDDSE